MEPLKKSGAVLVRVMWTALMQTPQNFVNLPQFQLTFCFNYLSVPGVPAWVDFFQVVSDRPSILANLVLCHLQHLPPKECSLYINTNCTVWVYWRRWGGENMQYAGWETKQTCTIILGSNTREINLAAVPYISSGTQLSNYNFPLASTMKTVLQESKFTVHHQW